MKLRALSSFAAALLLLAVVTVGLTRTYVRAGATMEVKGIPEHGLELLSREDPSFDQLASTALKGQLPAAYTALEPFAVILRNNTEKYVVGYAIRWEFMNPLGKRVHFSHMYNQLNFLLDRGLRKADPAGSQELLAPHSFRLLTPAALNLGPNSKAPQTTADQHDVRYVEQVASRFREGPVLRISLDGAFFEDGTFVGENRSNFFENMKAYVDTKQELLDEVLRAVSSGKRIGQVVDELEADVPPSDSESWDPQNPASFAKHYRRRHAEELIGIRKAMGDNGAIAHARRERYRARPNLRRVDQ